MIARLPLDSRFACSDPTDKDRFLRAIKIRNTISFGGLVNPSVIVVRFYDMLKNTTGMKEILRRQNSRRFLAKILPLRYQMYLLLIAREDWWVNQE
jgi:hypothetical protein